jgi:cell division protein FtsN
VKEPEAKPRVGRKPISIPINAGPGNMPVKTVPEDAPPKDTLGDMPPKDITGSAPPKAAAGKTPTTAMIKDPGEQPLPAGEIQNRKPRPTPKYPYKSLSYRYSLWLGSYRSLDRVQKADVQYSQAGLSPYWVKVDIKDKGTWYRVYTGFFKNRGEARRFSEAHDIKGAEIKKTIYGNLIDIYDSSGELGDRIQSLENLGYSPYVIEDPEGKSRLFVGAFGTRKEAEKQCKDLQLEGVQNQVVKR